MTSTHHSSTPTSRSKFPVGWLPAAVAVACGLIVLFTILWNRPAMGPLWWLLISANLLGITATIWPLVFSPWTDDKLTDLRKQLHSRIAQLDDDRNSLTIVRDDWNIEVVRQSTELQQREQRLNDKLVTFHEWLEFPQPFHINESPAVDSAISGLVEKDRQMLELLKVESQRLFAEIRANKFVVDGKFQPLMLRDDAWQLAERVARIYRPGSEQPLLETTPEQIFRAASRVSLQFLVALDELPLNVKEYNLNSLYHYVRQAVKALDVYKSVEPYWAYVNSAFYLSRLALGANPLSLGAWWFVTAVGKKGAKRITEHVVNRHAISLLHNLIRVIGFEVAALYGGDFRHRDANWIYAMELVELVHSFTASRESLNGALQELGALQLRSEYDRVFLYRCLAAHESPHPERFLASACLSMEERRIIANRLEAAFNLFIQGKTKSEVANWHEQVEGRLQVKLSAEISSPREESLQRADAVRSLASFLVGIKECEPSQLAGLLAASKTLAGVTSEQHTDLLRDVETNPPFFFEHPNIDPESPIALEFLEDLARLAATVAPRAARIDKLLADTALYLRRDAKEMRRRIETYMRETLASKWSAETAARKVPLAVARAVLDLVSEGELIRYIFDDVFIECPNEPQAIARPRSALWLIGIEQRMVAVDMRDDPRVIWRADSTIRIEQTQAYFFRDCRVHGGEWISDDVKRPANLRLSGAKWAGYETYFGPLLQHASELAKQPIENE